jgi:Lrp/AsnC family transcriptional regulator for asnA, asnC and gidA
MKIDETNIEIIKHLRDGRKSFGAIAEALSITENTVRSRVNKLVEEGILEISGLVDPESLPGYRMIVIGIKLSTVELVRKGHELTNLRGVISVSVVTGRYDILLQVLLDENKGFGLLEFFTKELSKIDEIQEVETFVVYKSYNLRVPYIL